MQTYMYAVSARACRQSCVVGARTCRQSCAVSARAHGRGCTYLFKELFEQCRRPAMVQAPGFGRMRDIGTVQDHGQRFGLVYATHRHTQQQWY